jgi:hypothetical protein
MNKMAKRWLNLDATLPALARLPAPSDIKRCTGGPEAPPTGVLN